MAKAKNHTSPDIPAVCFELASEVCSKPLDKPAQAACQKLSGNQRRDPPPPPTTARALLL